MSSQDKASSCVGSSSSIAAAAASASTAASAANVNIVDQEQVSQRNINSSSSSSSSTVPFDVNVYLAQRQMQTFAQARAYALAQAHAFESYAVERAQLNDHSSIYSKTTTSIYANEAAVGQQMFLKPVEEEKIDVSPPPADRADQNAPDLLLNFYKVASSHELSTSSSTKSPNNIVEGLPTLNGSVQTRLQNGSTSAETNSAETNSAETNSDSSSDKDKAHKRGGSPENSKSGSGPSASDISETSSESTQDGEVAPRKRRSGVDDGEPGTEMCAVKKIKGGSTEKDGACVADDSVVLSTAAVMAM
jgi:hypothetical protein